MSPWGVVDPFTPKNHCIMPFFSVSSVTIYMFYRLFLPESPEVQYHFRPRSHDKLLIPKTADLSDRDVRKTEILFGFGF